ncbi:Proton-gated ion channel [Trichinella pseudospiralis]
MSSAKWQTCPEWDLKYLKQVEDGETKNGPHPGARSSLPLDKEECKLFLALWAGRAHAPRPWSRNDVNWSEKIRNHEWIWSHVARLGISRDITEITHGSKI